MENELFDLVVKAQEGDSGAMYEIIKIVLPALRNARHGIKPDRQDDLEQSIIEIIIKKVMSYDLSTTPDFTTFCRQLPLNHQ